VKKGRTFIINEKAMRNEKGNEKRDARGRAKSKRREGVLCPKEEGYTKGKQSEK
jgi:hypothetical protein